jgi:hypothetical protein
MTVTKTPTPSRAPLYLAGVVELLLVLVAGVLVLAAATAQAAVQAVQRFAGRYATENKVSPVFAAARVELAGLVLAAPASAAARTPKVSLVKVPQPKEATA